MAGVRGACRARPRPFNGHGLVLPRALRTLEARGRTWLGGIRAGGALDARRAARGAHGRRERAGGAGCARQRLVTCGKRARCAGHTREA